MDELDSRIAVIKEKRALAITNRISAWACEFNLQMNPPLNLSEVVQPENKFSVLYTKSV